MRARRYRKRSSPGNSAILFSYWRTRDGTSVSVSDFPLWAVSRRSTGELPCFMTERQPPTGTALFMGGGLTAAFDVYLTDRIVFLLQVKERALFGTDAGNFHTQIGLGLRVIIN